ncbi:MAG: sugar transferase [Caulobacteraceae bacterium]|nr:sugar transferase [Caulobacteraceae bacterium]
MDAVWRVIDIVVAAAGLVFVAPLLLSLMALIWVGDGGSPIFAQTRIGMGGRRFRCLKLRTMCVDAEQRLAALLIRDAWARAEWVRDHKLRDDPRITAFGHFLRKSSLDELPQLVNVLKGEMSLVGPRPIVEAEVARYGRWFAHYASVQPGLTGLWQVSGRNLTTYRRRVAADALYARRKCLMLNLKIVLATAPAILFAQGSF